jgi:hypothetical protein
MKKLLLAVAFIAGFTSLASAQNAERLANKGKVAPAPAAANTPAFTNAKGERPSAVVATAPAAAPAKKAVTKKAALKAKKG